MPLFAIIRTFRSWLRKIFPVQLQHFRLQLFMHSHLQFNAPKLFIAAMNMQQNQQATTTSNNTKQQGTTTTTAR